MRRLALAHAAAIVLLILATSGAQAKVFDRIVAIVNDGIVTLSELDDAARPLVDRLLATQAPGALLEKQIYDTKLQMLRMLVDQRLAQQEITRLGISVSREDVDRVIEDVKRDSSLTDDQLRAALKQEGMGWEEYRKQVSEQLCRARLINEEVRTKIVISDERCRKYFQDNADSYRTFDEAELEQLLFVQPGGANDEQRAKQKKRAEEALAGLKAGADFATLAKQQSEAPSAKEGGYLGWVRTSEMAPYLKEAVGKLKPGQLSEVVSTEQGFQVFRLKGYRQGGMKPFEQVKDEIYRKLFNQDVDHEYEVWLKALRDKAYIKITY